MSIYLGDKLISGVATPVEPTRNIGQIIQSLLPLTDAGLHLLDGALIDGNGIYKAFVDYIKKLDLTLKCFTTEADWQASVTQYGVCGKFVYDATANTVRLPKVTGFLEGTIDASALGDLVEAGLPNITGTINITGQSSTPTSGTGVFSYSKSSTWSSYQTSGNNVYGGLTFDASVSNPIYGNSDTVQPQSIKGYYYIVIATSTKTDVEVDIDNVVTDLNNKADRDLTNVVDTMSASAKSYFSGLPLPSETKVSLTVGSSGAKYTAPANGWFIARQTNSSSNGNLYLERSDGGIVMGFSASNMGKYFSAQARKGDIFTLNYSGSATLSFTYAEGEV